MNSMGLKMNPSTHSTSLKEIRLFLWSLVEGHFILFIFHSNFHFLDLIFLIASAISWDSVL